MQTIRLLINGVIGIGLSVALLHLFGLAGLLGGLLVTGLSFWQVLRPRAVRGGRVRLSR